MRRGPAIVVLVALLLTGIGVGGMAAAQPTPPATESALRAPFPDGVLDTMPDSGPAADRRAVRAAAFQALDDESRTFTIDARYRHEAHDRVLAAVTSRSAERARLRVLGRTRTGRLAGDLARAYDWYVRHDFGRGHRFPGAQDVYASGRFHVDSWQGVQVVGNTARAVVMGETRGRAWNGRAKRDAWAQYQLLFERSPHAPHGWRLVRKQAASTAA